MSSPSFEQHTMSEPPRKRLQHYLRQRQAEAGKAFDADFQFWRSGPGYNRILDNDGTIWAAIDDIHLNPVRRGLCTHTADGSWSSAEVFTGLTGPFSIDRGSLPQTHEAEDRKSTTLSKTPKSWHPLLNASDAYSGAVEDRSEWQGMRTRRTHPSSAVHNRSSLIGPH